MIGNPSRSLSVRTIFRATTSSRRVSLALYTLPNVPSPIWAMISNESTLRSPQLRGCSDSSGSSGVGTAEVRAGTICLCCSTAGEDPRLIGETEGFLESSLSNGVWDFVEASEGGILPSLGVLRRGGSWNGAREGTGGRGGFSSGGGRGGGTSLGSGGASLGGSGGFVGSLASV